MMDDSTRGCGSICLVCGREGGNTIIVTSVHSFVSASGTPLADFINKIVGEEPCYSVSEVICQQCFTLLDRLDAYQARAQEIHTHVTTRYRDTKQELLGQRQRMSELIASSLSNVKELKHGTTLNVSDELTITIVHDALPKNKRKYRLQNGSALDQILKTPLPPMVSLPQTTLNFASNRLHSNSPATKGSKRKRRQNKSNREILVKDMKSLKRPALQEHIVSALNNNVSYARSLKDLVPTKPLVQASTPPQGEQPQQEKETSSDDEEVDSDKEEIEVEDKNGNKKESEDKEDDDDDDDDSSSSSDSSDSSSSEDDDEDDETEDNEENKENSTKSVTTGEASKEEEDMEVEDVTSEASQRAESALSYNSEEQRSHGEPTIKRGMAKSDMHEMDIAQVASGSTGSAMDSQVAEAMLMQSPLATSLLQSFLATSLWFGSPDNDKKKKKSVQMQKDRQVYVSDEVTSETLAVAAGSTKDKKKRQELKNTGQSYINTKGKMVQAKCVWPQDCSRCLLKCNDRISEDERLTIFQEYWGLADYDRQRAYLANHMKRERKMGSSGMMRTIILYFLTKKKKKLQVCRQYFLKTLDVSEKASRIVLEKMVKGEVFNPDYEENIEPPQGDDDVDDEEEKDDDVASNLSNQEDSS
ncbi:unnamed protein product [Meganyctiphanes norvegica]|uniref:ZAD domain-containing protein n=1 Tax=Meganyctiphanes norvegica TaxID=48144 RepID=A0AAV2PIT5_MEGNR